MKGSMIKTPPVETESSIKNRRLVILSFWLAVLCLGIPAWIWTTSIMREPLPLDKLHGVSEGSVCRPTFPLEIPVRAQDLKTAEALHLLELAQNALDDSSDFALHHLRLSLVSSIKPLSRAKSLHTGQQGYGEGEVKSTTESREAPTAPPGRQVLALILSIDDSLSTPQVRLSEASAELDIRFPSNLVPSPSISTANVLSTLIANELHALYSEEKGVIRSTLHSGKESGSMYQQRSLRYAPQYHISLSLFTPSDTPNGWEIQDAVSEYLNPVLDMLQTVANFTVDSQIQLHARPAPSVRAPEFDADINSWTLLEEDLSSFVNAAEWPLGPSVGEGPTIHFVFYVPDAKHTPLVIRGSNATSWSIPQWGGVYIMNTDTGMAVTQPERLQKLSKEALRPAFMAFSLQLLGFMGMPRYPPPFVIRMQSLTRIRTAALFSSASSTLGSLARLTMALPSIPIPKTVMVATEQSLEELQLACQALGQGHFSQALQHAQTADLLAERAFFEKSMVGQVYFPDEHKVAVYLPLLGPIGVPLVTSAIKEFRKYLHKR